MKISPVAGTPTLPQSPTAGLSLEKLQNIKKIAMGEKEEAPHEESLVVGQETPPTDKVIKMQTTKPKDNLDAPQEKPTGPGDGGIPMRENALPDADVQTKPDPEATQEVSPQIAALAKHKRALQVKERELAEKEKALETKSQGRAELEQRVKAGQALSVLEDLGITYDQLTNELLGKQSTPDFNKFQEELLKKVDERFAAKDTGQEEAVFSHIQRNVDKLTASDDYPFVKEEKAQGKVLELIKRAWHEDGEVLDEDEAIGLIEAELREKAKSYARLLEAKIIKEPEPTTPAAAEPSQKQVGIKTLTNRDSARPQSNRRQRALAAFLGQKQG